MPTVRRESIDGAEDERCGIEHEQRTEYARRNCQARDHRATEAGRPLRDAEQAVCVLQTTR